MQIGLSGDCSKRRAGKGRAGLTSVVNYLGCSGCRTCPGKLPSWFRQSHCPLCTLWSTGVPITCSEGPLASSPSLPLSVLRARIQDLRENSRPCCIVPENGFPWPERCWKIWDTHTSRPAYAPIFLLHRMALWSNCKTNLPGPFYLMSRAIPSRRFCN